MKIRRTTPLYSFRRHPSRAHGFWADVSALLRMAITASLVFAGLAILWKCLLGR